MQGRTDADLAQDIRDLLGYSPDVNNANVDVYVNHGVARLRGIVATPNARTVAERIARSVPGVADVVNELTVAVPGQGQGER